MTPRALVGVAATGLALAALVAWPAAAILRSALAPGEAGPPIDVARPLALAWESVKLVALTEALALPAGVALAWLLFRTDLRGRRVLLAAILLGLFVPLPLQALAWLGSFGNVGREQALGAGPVLVGLAGAAVVHAVSALPWVVLLAGLGFLAVEPELEESARLERPGWRVVAAVSLRRSAGAIAGAAMIVAVLTAGDMTVTDRIPLRTYAEESYTLSQLGLDGGRLALRASIPQVLAIGLLVLVGLRALGRIDPARVRAGASGPRTWPLGPWRWPLGLAATLAVAALLGLPLYGLVWRAGRVGSGLSPGRGAAWSVAGLMGTLAGAWEDLVDPSRPLVRAALPGTVLWAGLGATLAVAVAWPLAWGARRPGGVGAWPAFAVVTLLLATPAPIVGMAYKMAYARAGPPGPGAGAIARALRLLNETPALMVMGLAARALPFAFLILWPALRSIPQGFLDAAALDGLDPAGRAGRVGRPASRRAIGAAWLLSFAMALGELPTSYFLRASRYEPVSLYVWEYLHRGADSRLSGAGLILLAVAVVPGALALALARPAYARGR